MSDPITQAMLEEMRRMREMQEKSNMLQQQQMQQSQKHGENYPPNQRRSPKPPSVLAQERQSETIPGTSSKAIDAAREVQEKVVAPMFQKTFGQLLNKQPEESTADEPKKSGIFNGIKQALSPTLKVLSKKSDSDEKKQDQPAQAERRVVNKAQEVTITEISPKAKKGFGSIFSGLFKGKSDKKSITEAGGKKESEGGFLSGLMSMLLGGMSIPGIGTMFSGMVLTPLLGMLGTKLLGLITAPFSLIGKGIGLAVDGIGIAGKAIANSKIGQSVSRLFSSMGTKLSNGLELVKKSRIGQAVGRLFGGIGEKIGGIGTSVMNGLKKVPGVGRLTTALSSGLGGVASSIGRVAGNALKIAGPVGAVISTGISAFEGATAAIDEDKKSGSLSAAAREGLASFTESFTFGLLDKEMVSSGLSKAGKAITDVTDTIVGGVKSLWGKAKGFLFGSPHASTYVASASDQIHDGTVKLADSSLKVANAAKTFSEANKSNQQQLVSSANTLDKSTVDVARASDINQQLSKDAINRVNKSSESLAKIDSAGVADSTKILSQTERGTKSLGTKVKETFAKFSPLSIISNAASTTVNNFKDAITRISNGENVLTVLGDTLLKNAKTALSTMGKLLLSPLDAIKSMTGWFSDSEQKATKQIAKVSGEKSIDQQKTTGVDVVRQSKPTQNTATFEQMSKLTRVNQDILRKTGKAPVVNVDAQSKPPMVNVDVPKPTVIDKTRIVTKSSSDEKTLTNRLSENTQAVNNIKLINDVRVPEKQPSVEQIKPVIVDRTDTRERLDNLKTQQTQATATKTNMMEAKIENHLSKLVSIQEAQLQQAVNTNQNTGRMTESLQNIKPTQNNMSIVNQSSTKVTSSGSAGLDNYRTGASNYNGDVL